MVGFLHKVVMGYVEEYSMKKENKQIGIIIALSVILYLIVMLTRIFQSNYLATTCFTASYFIFTLVILRYFKERSELSINRIVTAIIIGSFILEIPIRILDFKGSIFTLSSSIFTMVAIILAALSYKEKRASVYFMSILTIFFLDFYVQGTWLKACNKYLNTEYKECVIFDNF